MAVHIGIVVSPYDRLILEGRKAIEARLTRTAMPPFGRIAPGERVFLKRSGGPFFAVAVVDRVWMADRLTPGEIERVRRQFDSKICGAPAYWDSRRDCRFATLIWLREVRPCTVHPRYQPQNMRAWYTLDDATDPLRAPSPSQGEGRGKGRTQRGDRGKNERQTALKISPSPYPLPRREGGKLPPAGSFCITLTAGAIRQNVLRVASVIGRFPPGAIGGTSRSDIATAPLSLHLLGGPAVSTDVVGPRKMIRWRGWGSWFAQHGLGPGDQVRFTPRGENAFDVGPVHS